MSQNSWFSLMRVHLIVAQLVGHMGGLQLEHEEGDRISLFVENGEPFVLLARKVCLME
jgi:hypothetical protein